MTTSMHYFCHDTASEQELHYPAGGYFGKRETDPLPRLVWLESLNAFLGQASPFFTFVQ